jgi:hypothetical protein
MKCVVAICVTLAMGALSVSAGDSPNLSDDALLASLSGPQWNQRREAIHQLIELGPKGEARLHELLKRDLDREQRKNVELALQLIEENRLFGASPITLHVSDAPVSQVMAEIARQCAGTIPTSPPDLWKQDWPKLTLDYDRKPFWDVLDDIGRQLNLDYLWSDSQEVRVSRGTGHRDEVRANSGAFLLTASSYAARRGMSVDLSVYAEPKVVVLRVIDLKFDKAIDDQGNPLLSQSGRMGRGGRGFGGGMWQRRNRGPREVIAPFQRPGDDVNKIAELRGQVRLSVQGGLTRWEINDPLGMSAVTRMIDNMPVTLESLASSGGASYELHVRIPYDWINSTTHQDEVMELLHRGLHVYDAAGRSFSVASPDSHPGSGGSTDIEVDLSRDSKTGPPAKLIWEIPDQTRELVVPFAFKNIPIGDPFN